MDITIVIAISLGMICLLGLIAMMMTAPARSQASAGPENVADARSRARTVPTRAAAPITNGSQDREVLRERLIQAGLYKKNSKSYFYFIQFVMASVPFAVAFVAYSAGLISLQIAGILALITCISGIVFPGLFLDYRKKVRQTKLRRALPDALDVINVCVEAGLSLNSALIRVSRELKTAHEMLSSEMTIVHREIQMGKSSGDALKDMANRFDVEELRSLASVIQQSERFGASITAALKVYAESLRERRMQQAQIRAQKAAVKLLFPTVLLIFPALIVVILGPAAFDIYHTLMVTR